MAPTILFTIFLLPLIASTNGRVLEDCDVVHGLQRANVQKNLLRNWVCLAKAASGLNTNLVTGPKTASSYCFGIFQICSLKWCTRGRKGGVCNARCEDFHNDDITDDIACAQKIYNADGFKAWDGWTKKCKNKPLPDINHCLGEKIKSPEKC